MKKLNNLKMFEEFGEFETDVPDAPSEQNIKQYKEFLIKNLDKIRPETLEEIYYIISDQINVDDSLDRHLKNPISKDDVKKAFKNSPKTTDWINKNWKD